MFLEADELRAIFFGVNALMVADDMVDVFGSRSCFSGLISLQ